MVGSDSKSNNLTEIDFSPEDLEVQSYMNETNRKVQLEFNENNYSSPKFDLMQNHNSIPEASMASSSSFAELNEFDSEMLVKEDPITNPVSDILLIFPDFIFKDSKLYEEAQLVFTSDSIRVKCLDTSADIDVVYAVNDILRIESQWNESVSATLVKFQCSRSPNASKDKIHETLGFTDLIFSVTGTSWLDQEQKIKCLAERYKLVWNISPYGNHEMGEACMVQKDLFSTYDSTDIPHSFEDFVYPKGDPDAITISRRDIELLEPDTFVNDTIIDFYITYLKTKVSASDMHRYHFFNCFFFRKLADLDNSSGRSEGRAAFLRVCKWTRKVNIFEKDYIFIPVNFNLHWSLLIVCHPGEVCILKDDEVKDSPKVPCILHLDSIRGKHSGLKGIIQSYLLEEWKERHGEENEDYTFKFSDLRFLSLELPQQENAFDCGLFLLQYVEMFLHEAPLSFNPFKISKWSSFLTANWFVPSEASLKRSIIWKLMYDLVNDSLHNATPESRLYDIDNTKDMEGVDIIDVDEKSDSHGPIRKKRGGPATSNDVYISKRRIVCSQPGGPRGLTGSSSGNEMLENDVCHQEMRTKSFQPRARNFVELT